jgi:hypothetical protein
MVKKMLLPGGKSGMEETFQLGDMGIFDESDIKELDWHSNTNRFIPGNHDNPELVVKCKGSLGYWGYDKGSGLFWLGGGLSIDKDWRLGMEKATGYKNWWEGEELSPDDLEQVVEAYRDLQPIVVASHECPSSIKRNVVTNPDKLHICSRTENTMNCMLYAHKPDFWVFGHHHKRLDWKIDNTQFVALHEMIHGSVTDCYYNLPWLKWSE